MEMKVTYFPIPLCVTLLKFEITFKIIVLVVSFFSQHMAAVLTYFTWFVIYRKP